MNTFTSDTWACSTTDAVGARDPIGLTSQVRYLREGFEQAGHGRPALLLVVVKDGEQNAAMDLIRDALNSKPDPTIAQDLDMERARDHADAQGGGSE